MCYRNVPDVSKVVLCQLFTDSNKITSLRSSRDQNSQLSAVLQRLRNLVAAHYTTRAQATVMYQYSPRVFSVHY